jgi:hypothetical protein
MNRNELKEELYKWNSNNNTNSLIFYYLKSDKNPPFNFKIAVKNFSNSLTKSEFLKNLEIIESDELIGNLGDTHLYLNHIDAAKEQITREPYELPKLVINDEEPSIIEKTKYWRAVDFEIANYNSHPSIKAPLSN